MMDALKEWLLAVMITATVLSVGEKLVLKGPIKQISALCGSLVMLLTLLQPVLDLKDDLKIPEYSDYGNAIGQLREELERENRIRLAEIIAEETEAYISDKAESLGIQCNASVLLETETDTIPQPTAVELDCEPNTELSAYLENELGIPKERQVFYGGKANK